MKRLVLLLAVMVACLVAFPAAASANHGWHINGGTLAGTIANSGGSSCFLYAGTYHVQGQQDIQGYSGVDCHANSAWRTQCWPQLYDLFTLRAWSNAVVNGNYQCYAVTNWGAQVARNGSPYWWTNAQSIITLVNGRSWGTISDKCVKNSNVTISCQYGSPFITYN
jgi:hypothetical protein